MSLHRCGFAAEVPDRVRFILLRHTVRLISLTAGHREPKIISYERMHLKFMKAKVSGTQELSTLRLDKRSMMAMVSALGPSRMHQFSDRALCI